MGSMRVRRGHGQDMGGKTIRSRTANTDTDFLSPLEKGMIAKQFKTDLKGAKAPDVARGSAPRPDPGVAGGKMAHMALGAGGVNVYRETPGGRRGTSGKRRSEL